LLYYEDVLGKSGLDDFALIRDFVPAEDTIQLHGNSRDYQLDRNPSGLPDGTAIFHHQTELIAIIEGDASLNLGDRSFRFR
jgi:hypothetical protein